MAESKPFPRDHYTEVTNRIIAALEAGPPPWRRPWNPDNVGADVPRNGITGHRYRGINTLILGLTSSLLTSHDPRWLSFRQATERNWRVRKGERATIVYFYKQVPIKEQVDGVNDGGAPLTVPVLRSYPLFNASQVEGVPDYSPPSPAEIPWRTPETASVILLRSGATLREGGDRAFYAPAIDAIQLPPAAAFRSAEGWAATLLHELGHWSGHASRLNRNLSGRFGSHDYAIEELRVELASAYIGLELGIPSEIENHASYIESWLAVLRRDKREIFRAAADAQRISDYLLGFHPLYAAKKAAEAAPVTDVDPQSRPVVLAATAMPEHIRRSLGIDRSGNSGISEAVPADVPAAMFRPR